MARSTRRRNRSSGTVRAPQGAADHRHQDQRIAALRNDKADICTINYENLPWLVEHLGDVWPFDTVTADEASKLRSFRLLQGGKRAQALASVAHTKVRHGSTSPAPSRRTVSSNLWAPMWFIDRGQRLDRSYDSFNRAGSATSGPGCGERAQRPRISRIAFPHAFGEITGLMRDVTLALNPKDWFAIKGSDRGASVRRSAARGAQKVPPRDGATCRHSHRRPRH